jgi:hypothetical protein
MQSVFVMVSKHIFTFPNKLAVAHIQNLHVSTSEEIPNDGLVTIRVNSSLEVHCESVRHGGKLHVFEPHGLRFLCS